MTLPKKTPLRARALSLRPGVRTFSQLPLAACSYLVITNVLPELWCGNVSEERKIIGRSSSAQMRVGPQFAHVSRRHAEIWRDTAGIWLLDLGSRGGTQVNGVPLVAGQPHRLLVGDRIWMGGLELQLLASESLKVEQVAGTNSCAGNPPETEDGKRTAQRSEPQDLDLGAEFQPLSPAEREIVLWLCRGYTDDDEIAQALNRSANTIRTHLANIFRKLGVHSRSELIGHVRRAANNLVV